MSEQEAQVTFLFWSLVTSDGETSSSAKGGRSSPHHPGTQSGAASLGIHPQRLGMPSSSHAVLCCLDHLSVLILRVCSLSSFCPSLPICQEKQYELGCYGEIAVGSVRENWCRKVRR